FAPTCSSCSHNKISNSISYQFKSNNNTPDYSNLNYWASHPWKTDPSDNIPSPLLNNKIDSIADVFFIHPTTYTELAMSMGWNAEIDDEAINKKTDNGTILYQASVFNQHCRIFAPRYRQANLKAFYTTNKVEKEKAFNIAYNDVKAAFEYYLKHYNNGKPIIIASHSQGTLHAGRLLKEFFENNALQKKLVCAYIIGLPVFTNYFKDLQPCKDSTATSCFVSWRTFKEEYIPEFVRNEKEKAIVTNPLTWKIDEGFASASLNKGGILRDFNKVIPGLVHAQVHNNILWVNKPNFFGSVFLTMKNYHIVDYNLFYSNIRENVETRIRHFLKNH
ncbi:MAG TPA: DUF3089 domain-containing protein, partial [Chitinophagaceae bacterium]|nr:DUF3089 domain-containing protein [Chitinophagaceae bacterium]